MTNIKPSSHGIVVDHKEAGVRYAISDRNYRPEVHRKVRDLGPGETVLGFRPKPIGSLAPEQAEPTEAPKPETTKTEGSPSGGTKDAK